MIGLPKISPLRLKLTRNVISIPGRAASRLGGVQHECKAANTSRIVLRDPSSVSLHAGRLMTSARPVAPAQRANLEANPVMFASLAPRGRGPTCLAHTPVVDLTPGWNARRSNDRLRASGSSSRSGRPDHQAEGAAGTS